MRNASALLDTADINSAHACGLDREHGLNSEDRFQVFAEFGGLTICRGSLTIQLDSDEAEALLDALTAHSAAKRNEAFASVRVLR